MRKNIKSKRNYTPVYNQEEEEISLQSIADALKRLKFKKSLFGVNEQDVWKKIRRLDAMYQELYQMQEIKYKALINDKDRLLDSFRAALKRQLPDNKPSISSTSSTSPTSTEDNISSEDT